MSLGYKKNDTVVVITGKDKGRRGRVLQFDHAKERVVVEKVNMVKKHMKPNQTYKQGGIIEREAPLHSSNVMMVCPKCDKPTRISTSVFEGTKARVCKKCKEVMDK